MINWKLLKVFCLLLGILCVIMAITVYSGSVGYYESSERYGGDAYTGIQNAAAQTANNVMYLGKTIRSALGTFLLVQGLCMLFGGLCIRGKAKVAPVQPVYQPVPVQPVPPVQPVAPVQPVPVQPVPVQPTPVQPTPVQPTPVQPQASAWLCPNCGKPNAENHRFCLHCGTARQ